MRTENQFSMIGVAPSCVYCGSVDLITKGHVVPLLLGTKRDRQYRGNSGTRLFLEYGQEVLQVVQPECDLCNRTRAHKLEEFLDSWRQTMNADEYKLHVHIWRTKLDALDDYYKGKRKYATMEELDSRGKTQ